MGHPPHHINSGNVVPIIFSIVLSAWTVLGTRWIYRAKSPAGGLPGGILGFLWVVVFLLGPLVLVLLSVETFVPAPAPRIALCSLFIWLVPWSLYATALRYAVAPELACLPRETRRRSQKLVVFGGLALVLTCLGCGLASLVVVALATGQFLDMDGPATSGAFAFLVFAVGFAAVAGPMLGIKMWSAAAGKLLPRDIVEIVRARSGLH